MKDERIFIVHVVYHFVIGGLENGIVNLINELPRDKFRHAVVCVEDFSNFRDRIKVPGVEVVALYRSRIGIWRMRLAMFRLFRKWRPDIVHSRNLSGLDALLPAKLAGAKTLHSEHGFDVNNLRGLAAKPALLRRLHAPLVDGYACVSSDLRNLMIQRWGVPASRIRHIYNGVDTDKFEPASPASVDILPAHLCAENTFVVGTVGRIQPVKDQQTLLRAFAAAVNSQHEMRGRLRLVVVGDGPLLQSMKDLSVELGVAGQTWFTGARDDVAALMRGFDLFVLPSLNEGISNTLLEAMATGLPLLATAVGGNPELVQDGTIGSLFEPGDVARLAELITKYQGDRDLCREHANAARQHAVERFSLRAMMNRYSEAYLDL